MKTLVMIITRALTPSPREIIVESAFQKLKKRFIIALILATFNLERQIVLKTDALDYAINICISQPNNKG
jgi:tricorn protease-like protein